MQIPQITARSNILGQLGNLIVKIADCPEEIEAAQHLRHLVFNSEKAVAVSGSKILKDEDYFDQYCDHLVVIERCEAPDRNTKQKVIATYRLMGPKQAAFAGKYYSQSEFDVETLVKTHADLKFLELGRSCVLPDYRNKRTIELLWHGSWAYVRQKNYDVMFGCASFKGVDPGDHAAALAFLNENAAPEPGWNVAPTGEAVSLSDMGDLEKGTYEMKQALRSLPPLVKGYLRLGAMFASNAVIDREFGTIDVLVLLPVSRLNPRYVNYYGKNAERHAI